MRTLLAALSCAILTPAPSAPPAPAAVHVIRPGDTLSSVAVRHRLRTADLRAWNGPAPLRIDGLLRLTPPPTPLPRWRTRVTTVTPAEANGDPARRCPLPARELRRIEVRYLGFDSRAHDGHVIMHRTLVARTQRAFATLYRWRFPIMAMPPAVVPDKTVLTLGYECRYVAGTKRWSQHAYGRAIDINPRQNPMIRGTYLDPPNSAKWIPRTNHHPGMLHAAGAVPAFTREGFTWGGRWTTLKDYMHFSTTGR
ncbi:M15 family metallopeptidase [Actinoplanes sp. G11-F43]|uniref:M15 family metallopeptidase n=1 Tax=Actinoplanes sp. G11-F43 TaxID=3424130 RepID=UPI003D3260FE